MSGLLEHSHSWPDFDPTAEIEAIRNKSRIVPPPISPPNLDVEQFISKRKTQILSGEPLHLVWAARWEYDKNPNALLKCLELLSQQRVGIGAIVLDYRTKPGAGISALL